MEEKYERILKHCEKEVDRIIKMYKKQKDDPPVPRMFPPIAGKIEHPNLSYCKTKESILRPYKMGEMFGSSFRRAFVNCYYSPCT